MGAIYILGMLVCFLGLLWFNPQRSLSKLLSYALMSAFSWVGVFILLIAYFAGNADDTEC